MKKNHPINPEMGSQQGKWIGIVGEACSFSALRHHSTSILLLGLSCRPKDKLVVGHVASSEKELAEISSAGV